ncbi:tryptophan halogenase family protein [Sphingomonas sp.]|uniref:tryptophan halogenase family protein n=1 Tax=Sphingomonas sp. TaxID=28214 RepID=UPI003B0090EE
MTDTPPLARIVIVGGGTAGWLTAAYLSRTLARAGSGVATTVVESPDIPIIGVGEGSFPTLRSTLQALGRGEGEFVRAADATFKQGVRFVGWAGRPVPGSDSDDYFHVFELPYGGDSPGLLPAWLATDGAGRPSYADAVSAQGAVMRRELGPKRPGDPDWEAPFNYAYHFDAPKLAAWLREVAIANGVTRVVATVGEVVRGGADRIVAVAPDDGREAIAGDLFIDCTGFSARLIGETLGSRFRPTDDILFNDRALAVQIPYDRPDATIESYTRATAHDGGWIWDIGLSGRRGIGCVYSSRHLDDEAAERTLRSYAGPAADGFSVRQLRFRTGYRETQWIGNCVAIGLSAGFFEPLESTGIMLIEVAARLVAELAPNADPASLAAAARLYNRLMPARYAAIVEFLKLHYALSHRRGSDYWRDNTDRASWPAGLADKLDMWGRRPPSRFDFVIDHESFLPPNWQYILYGHGFDTPAPALGPTEFTAAHAAFARVRQAQGKAVAALGSHRALVDHFHRA